MILPEWTIADLQEKMESGELTARRIAELYLSRIEAVDKDGPYINSVIELNPEALEIVAFEPADIPWADVAFLTSKWAIRDWVRLRRPELLSTTPSLPG